MDEEAYQNWLTYLKVKPTSHAEEMAYRLWFELLQVSGVDYIDVDAFDSPAEYIAVIKRYLA